MSYREQTDKAKKTEVGETDTHGFDKAAIKYCVDTVPDRLIVTLGIRRTSQRRWHGRWGLVGEVHGREHIKFRRQ